MDIVYWRLSWPWKSPAGYDSGNWNGGGTTQILMQVNVSRNKINVCSVIRKQKSPAYLITFHGYKDHREGHLDDVPHLIGGEIERESLFCPVYGYTVTTHTFLFYAIVREPSTSTSES